MRETNLSSRDLIAVLFIVLIWGSNFVAMKIGLRDFTPLQLGLARYLFVIFPLLLFIKRPNLHWKWLVLYGFFQGFAQFAILFISLKVGMSAALASVVLQTQIFFTAFLSFIFLSERPSKSLWIGLTLAAFGLSCFIFNFLYPSAGVAQVTTFWGFVLCLLAASMWAASNVIIRIIQKKTTTEFDALGFIVWCGLMSTIPFMLATLILEPDDHANWLHASWQSWLCLAYLGWISILVANTLWTSLIRKYSANKIAPFSLGIPVFGLAAGMFFLGEEISHLQWAGIALVFLALIQVIFGERFRR
jgi:O-acetylserine/cysteine efflux transporter